MKPGEALRDLPKNKEARIDYVEKDGQKFATQISFKGPIKIAPEKVVGYDYVLKLVEQGPEKGNYTLIDSRPLRACRRARFRRRSTCHTRRSTSSSTGCRRTRAA